MTAWTGEASVSPKRFGVRLCLLRTLIHVQIFEEIDKLEQDGYKVARFSITGYSFGGLVARYVVG